MEQKVSDFMNRMRASAEILADKTGKAANHAADVAGKKAGTMVESTKLNLQIFDLNSEIDEMYKEIGKMIYDTHLGLQADRDELEHKLALIDEKRQIVEEIRCKLQDLRTVNQCPNCGKECSRDDAFCSGCGAQL
ncbi:MAG: zinc ribbon domain-containing protein [Butyricicoccus sp.]